MYIGQDEILKEEKDTEGYTKVFFKPIEKDGENIEVDPQIFSDLILEELRTPEPMDLGYIRKVRCTPAVGEILRVLLQYNVQLEDEVEYILRNVADSLNANNDRAVDKLFGQNRYKRTMLDVDKVLKS